MALRSLEIILGEARDNFPKLLHSWQNDPAMFFRDVLRVEPLAWQCKVLSAVADAKFGRPNCAEGICKRRFAIKSGVGVGKTMFVAGTILWGIGCFPDAKVPCTAPTSPQLKAVLWPEVNKWINAIPGKLREFLPFDHQTDRVTMLENFAVARTAREESPESFQGYHSRNVMLIADEAPGVADSIFMAGQGVMSEEGAITILIGNPNRAAGYFYECFHGNSNMWWTMTVSAFDSERVTKEFIEDMRLQHGENSYEYKVRVLGEFNLEDSGVIIPRPWIDEAVGREVSPDSDYIVWGVDVSDGRDKSALAKRMGNILLEPVKAWGGKDVMQSVGVVVDEYFSSPNNRLPDEICVDAIGMGTAFAGRLAEALKGEPVKITRVNVALTGSQIGDRFTSRRVELWARGRGWFESALCSIPMGCGEMISQLASVEWEVKDSNGKWAIIDKKAIGHSPDSADAFLLTFGGVKGAKSSFTKGSTRSSLMRNHGAEQYALTSASYLQRN